MKHLLFSAALFIYASTTNAQPLSWGDSYKQNSLKDSNNITAKTKSQKILLQLQKGRNKDSLLSSSQNGFNFKQSKTDNMVYADANNNNPATNSLAGKTSFLSTPNTNSKMPIKKFEPENFFAIKDTVIKMNGSIEKALPKH